MNAIKKSIMIRVDGSSHIGIGHVMRCLTLARCFSESGFSIDFYSINYSVNIRNKIIDSGFNVFDLPDLRIEHLSDLEPINNIQQLTDVDNCKALMTGNYTLIIIDNYRFGHIWEKEMSKLCNKLIVIDDLANRDHFCDFLIDQNIGRKKSEYIDLVEKKTKLMLGLDYVILRKEFKEYILKSKIKRRNTRNIDNILICFGGGNATDLIIKTTDSVIESGYLGNINIVISSDFPNIDDIVNKYKDNKKIVVDVDVISMSLAIYNADLSIGAFGSMSWERCCLGLPSISIQIADNQKYIAESLDKMGVSIKSVISDIPKHIKRLTDDENTLEEWHDISRKSFDICDAFGVERILSEVSN